MERQRPSLEKSKQSAKECRKRKKLRYLTLEAIAHREEKSILYLYDELKKVKEMFQRIDTKEISAADALTELPNIRMQFCRPSSSKKRQQTSINCSETDEDSPYYQQYESNSSDHNVGQNYSDHSPVSHIQQQQYPVTEFSESVNYTAYTDVNHAQLYTTHGGSATPSIYLASDCWAPINNAIQCGNGNYTFNYNNNQYLDEYATNMHTNATAAATLLNLSGIHPQDPSSYTQIKSEMLPTMYSTTQDEFIFPYPTTQTSTEHITNNPMYSNDQNIHLVSETLSLINSNTAS